MHRIPAHINNRLERLINIFHRYIIPFWYLYMMQFINVFIRLITFVFGSCLCVVLVKDEKAKTKHKMAWWANTWKRMRENFHQFYVTAIYGPYYTYDFGQRPREFNFLTNFRQRYLAIIMERQVELTDWIENRFEAIWADQAHNKANISISEAHVAVRKQLAREFLERLNEMLVDDLAAHIWTTISRMIDFIHNQMFLIDLDKIKLLLLADSNSETKKTKMGNDLRIFNVQIDYIEYLKHSVKFLLALTIRPVVDLFLRYPRELNRKHTIKLHELDVYVLEISQGYSNGNNGLVNLPANLLREINTVAVPRMVIPYPMDVGALVEPRLCGNRQEVRDQLREDVADFFAYLKGSVNFASSLEKFYQQEVDEIKNKFIDEEEERRGWQYFAFEAIDKNNPNIPRLNQLQHVSYRLNLNIVFLIFILVEYIRLKYFI